MPDLSFHRYDIAARPGRLGNFSEARDFVLTRRRGGEAAILPAGSLAYCADMGQERVLFTCHQPADLDCVLQAPFMFSEQFATARFVMSVPFAQVPDAAPSWVQPVLVFSPGRVGSTLLARVLRAAGLGCASEPDMLVQMAWLPAGAFLTMRPGLRPALAGLCIDALARALGPRPFIKLRSHCNMRPLALVQAAPGCRVIFMLRGLAAWAVSRHRTFGEPPRVVAGVLREAIDALDVLAQCGAPFDVLWYETLVADPSAALRICAPDATPDPARLAAVMAADSQADTILARALVADRAVDDGFPDDFDAAWTKARAGAAWSAGTRALVAQMAEMRPV